MTHPSGSSDNDAVRTRALVKRFGRELALDRLELGVPEGSVYVLIGANGAGKSTTLKLLMNLERPDSGEIKVFGLDTRQSGPEIRAQVGYVPERHDASYRWMTGARLLEHAAVYYPAWDHAYAARLSSAFDLRLGRRFGTLSKGEARRLQLVLALAHRPPLLLLDEPTDGLDPIVRRRALALLAEHLADTPTTVLISTHQVYELDSLADHVGVLRAGRLVAQMPRHELQRTVRRYRLEVSEDWSPPPYLPCEGMRRSAGGREVHLTLIGEEWHVTERLTLSGARVHESTSLALEDAALVFLAGTEST